MKKVFLFFLSIIFSATIFIPAAFAQNQSAGDLTQYGIRIEPDKRLIIVMAALEAADVNTPLTETGDEFRQKLHADLQGMPADLRGKIKAFVERHRKKHPQANTAELVAPFVALAYALNPEDLGDPPKSTELPSGLLEVLDFAPLVREFYRRSGIEQKIPEYTKIYQAEGDKMRFSTRLMVNELLGYLHTRPELEYVEKIKTETKDEKNKNKTVQKIETRAHERIFYVVPELLAPAGTINFQNVADNYYAVVPPETNLSTSDVRRAYLQFVVDPLILKNAREITPFREGIKQLLDERRKTYPNISPDIYLAVSRSLVAAIEARESEFQKVQRATAEARRKIDLAEGVEAKKAVSAELTALKQSLADETALQLSEAYERGAVLAFYFSDQLKGSEDSGFDIASSLRDMILSLEPAKEAGRLTQYADAKTRALATREASRNKKLELPTKLLAVNELIKNKKYSEAESELKKLLDENPGEPRIFYNLGRISGILAQPDITFDENLRDKRLEDAKAYYSNAIRAANTQTDPALIQLSYIALGRIYEFYDQNEMAMKIYDAAIKIGDVTGGAYQEAVAAKDKLTKKN